MLAGWRHRRQIGAMTSVQIKGVPKETHAVLRQRAARAPINRCRSTCSARSCGKPAMPTVDEVLDRLEQRTGGTLNFPQAVQAVRDDRDRR